VTHEYKTKIFCEICGRRIRSGIPVDSEEKALCSFCIKRKKDAIAKLKDEKRHFRVNAKPCKVCGKMAILSRLGTCPDCYFRDKFPAVTKVEEVKEDVSKI